MIRDIDRFRLLEDGGLSGFRFGTVAVRVCVVVGSGSVAAAGCAGVSRTGFALPSGRSGCHVPS